MPGYATIKQKQYPTRQCAWEGCTEEFEAFPLSKRYCKVHSLMNRRKKTKEYQQKRRNVK